MSQRAIAAVLARTDVASGERLVALSLASFAGRENRAWPCAMCAGAIVGFHESIQACVNSTPVPSRTNSFGCCLEPFSCWSS
jgi:hypothetical protein